jgi:hypothetical protein
MYLSKLDSILHTTKPLGVNNRPYTVTGEEVKETLQQKIAQPL